MRRWLLPCSPQLPPTTNPCRPSPPAHPPDHDVDKHLRTALCDKDPGVMCAALCALQVRCCIVAGVLRRWQWPLPDTDRPRWHPLLNAPCLLWQPHACSPCRLPPPLQDLATTDPAPYRSLVPSLTSILKQVRKHEPAPHEPALRGHPPRPPRLQWHGCHRARRCLPVANTPAPHPLPGGGAPAAQVVRLPPRAGALHPGARGCIAVQPCSSARSTLACPLPRLASEHYVRIAAAPLRPPTCARAAPRPQIKLLRVLAKLCAGDKAASDNAAAVVGAALKRAGGGQTISNAIVYEAVR